jgi:P-type E1-E2 ATPase
MITVEIPGFGPLQLSHLVLDYNGTLAVAGELNEGVKPRLARLARELNIHVITGDTYGKAAAALQGLGCHLIILPPLDQVAAKAGFILHLGVETVVAIGNGRNDRLMLEQAALGIAVLSGEGTAVEAVMAADIVARDVLAALDLLQDPLRLVATLRT